MAGSRIDYLRFAPWLGDSVVKMIGHCAKHTVARWRLVKQVLAIVLCCAFLRAQIAGPERKVEGNVITSERDPAVRVHVPKSAEYVGADRWVL